MTASDETGSYCVLLLGPLVVSHNGVRLNTDAWPRRSQAILKLLIITPEHRRSRDELIDLLWPDAAPETGMSNVRWAVHELRRGLGASDTILVEQGWLSLNRCYRWDSDLDRFNALLDADSEGAAMEQALELVRGEPLVEDRYEDWSAPIRTGIERRWREGCLRVAVRHRTHGAPRAALQWYERLLDRDPLDEEAVQALLALYRELGQRRDGLAMYERFMERLGEEVGCEPAPETVVLAERLRPPATPPPHNLPAPLTSFVGREADLEGIEALLRRDDVRLITLTGTPGVGKTRLALQVASAVLDTFPDGVFFVELAPIRDVALIPTAIATAVGIRETGHDSIMEASKAELRERELLLVLDNFEHLISAATLVTELLRACPSVTILATSRQPLHVYGEYEVVVSPLDVPDPMAVSTVEALHQSEAVTLFVQRAEAARMDFALTDKNGPITAEICARLDGLPLAIELAAARVRSLTVEALLPLLEHRLDVLTGGPADIDPRHQTLRDTIDWSYQLLDAEQQALFRRIAIFDGGCVEETLQAVCVVEGEQRLPPLGGIASLVDGALLQAIGGDRRFRMFETIREYGIERLKESQESETIARRHAEYYLHLAETAEPALRGPEQRTWLERLEQEHDNVRAALRWSVTHRQAEITLRLTSALWRFWFRHGHLTEGQRWLATALTEQPGTSLRLRAKALLGSATIADNRGDYTLAKKQLEESGSLFRDLGDKRGTAGVLASLASLVDQQGDYKQATALLEESITLFTEVGDQQGAARTLGNLASLVDQQGDYERAATIMGESIALLKNLGDKQGTSRAVGVLGIMELGEGHLASARELLDESVALLRELGDKVSIAYMLINRASVALSEADFGRASEVLRESEALFRELGSKRGIAYTFVNQSCVAEEQGDLTRAAQLLEEGVTLLQQLGDRWGVASALEELMAVATKQGQPRRAAQLWGAAEALREALGAPMPRVDRVRLERHLRATRLQLGETAWSTAQEEGRAMNLEKAIAFARDTRSRP